MASIAFPPWVQRTRPLLQWIFILRRYTRLGRHHNEQSRPNPCLESVVSPLPVVAARTLHQIRLNLPRRQRQTRHRDVHAPSSLPASPRLQTRHGSHSRQTCDPHLPMCSPFLFPGHPPRPRKPCVDCPRRPHVTDEARFQPCSRTIRRRASNRGPSS